MRLPAGYASRPATGDDLDAIIDVSAASDREDVGFEDPVHDALRDLWERPGFDLERHTAVVVVDRVPVAYAELFRPNPERTLESFARVHPAHRGRGLGGAILSWFESRARELAPGETTPALRIHGPHGDEGFRRLAGSRGFASARVFWHMSRDLSDVIEPSAFPDGVGVRGYRHEQDAGGVYDAVVESFAGHWGFERPTRTVLEEEMRHYDADLVDLAMDGPTVVGLSIAKVVDRWGWIDVLGVRPAWRGRGIARALLLRSFAGLSRRGAGTVTLDVDSANETGATRLYESVGMRVHRAWEIFEKPLAAAYAGPPEGTGGRS